jgi:ABC-2 type transport system permease protein
MSTIASTTPLPRRPRAPGVLRPALAPLGTLSRRRLQLTVRTPRELVVPMLTPILFALIIAPALKAALHTSAAYESFVAVGTIGLLIPLNAMLSGIGVIVDRESGAQRELLAAPVPRGMLVLANLAVALAVTCLQVATLIVAALLRGIDFHASGTGIVWFVATAALFTVGMYGVAEVLAGRVDRQEEYVSRLPVIAILPWFLAGSLFPIDALPTGLTSIGKVLPLTHALAVMRYGLDGDAAGLRNIWGMSDPSRMAGLSLLVVATFAVALSALAVRAFARSAVR